MDWRSTTHRSGSSQSFGIAGVAFAFLCLIAWQLDAGPPPSIKATGGTQSLVVLDTTQPAIFPEQPWHLIAPNPFGASIVVWTVAPFHNVVRPENRVDAGLFLRMRTKGQSNRDWQVVIPQARTSFRTGQPSAHVVAGSYGGNGEAGVTVSFLCHEQPVIADGNYETTVIGTITEAF